MAKPPRDLQTVLNELTTAVQNTGFDLLLRYSYDGWQVTLGNASDDFAGQRRVRRSRLSTR
jgi:hypothetical protein